MLQCRRQQQLRLAANDDYVIIII